MVIPDGVVTIGDYAFSGCDSINSMVIPDSVITIGDYTFYACNNLSSIYIPESVKSIGVGAFMACKALTSITIPKNVNYIGEDAFQICWALTSIKVDSHNTVYDSRDNCNAIIETETNTLLFGCMNSIIPESISTIGNHAFAYCNGLTSINIPKSVTSIGSGAFFLTSNNLKSIKVDSQNPIYDSRDNSNAIIETGTNAILLGCMNTIIPENITCIREFAFNDCHGMTYLNIPAGVTDIERYAFQSCNNVKTLSIPESVTCIGQGVFNNCDSLKSVYCYIKTPIDYVDAFDFKTYSTATLYVPSESVEAYRNSDGWNNFQDIQSLTTTDLKNILYEYEADEIIDSSVRIIKSMKNGQLIINQPDGSKFNAVGIKVE